MRLDPKRLDTDPSGYSIINPADGPVEFASVSMRLDSTRLDPWGHPPSSLSGQRSMRLDSIAM